ncbi:MAG: hypothetical protein RIQ60_809 [Pseudomonadota bacterium]|jgi:type I restriction enzyme S subunit
MTTVKLGDVVQITSGFAFPSSGFSTEEGIPLVRIRDVTRGVSETRYAGPFDEDYVVNDGNLLVGMDGEFNAALWRGGRALLNQRVCRLVPDPSRLDFGFLRHVLPRELKAIEDRTPFVTVKHLSVKDIRAIVLALPPLAEQRRIATILDKADSLRCKRQEAIRLADEVLKAAFVDMFGAPSDVAPSLPTKPLGDVCRFYAGNSLPEGEPFAGQLDGVLHIKVGDMNLPGNESVVSTSREWSANGAGGIVAPQGAILIPKRGGAIATNKKRLLGRACALDPNLMAISPGPDLRQELLFQWFKLFDLSTITSGSAVPQLNKGDLAPLRIVVPPLDQQDRFAAIAQRVTSIINKQVTQLGDIESACRALTDDLLVA